MLPGSHAPANEADGKVQPHREFPHISIERSSTVRNSLIPRIASRFEGAGQKEPAGPGRQSSGNYLSSDKLVDIKPTQLQSSVVYVNERILANLPNDLTKLVYLASLRDNNTGTYLHPQLSRLYDVAFANQVLLLCHEEAFAKILAASIQQYVNQMSRYIQFTGADQREVIATWKSLQAYRATVPVSADRLSVEVFCLQIDTTLSVLEEALKSACPEDATSSTRACETPKVPQQ